MLGCVCESERASINLRVTGDPSGTRDEDRGQGGRYRSTAAIRQRREASRRDWWPRQSARCTQTVLRTAGSCEDPSCRLDLEWTIGGKSDRGGGISPRAEGVRLYRRPEHR